MVNFFKITVYFLHLISTSNQSYNRTFKFKKVVWPIFDELLENDMLSTKAVYIILKIFDCDFWFFYGRFTSF